MLPMGKMILRAEVSLIFAHLLFCCCHCYGWLPESLPKFTTDIGQLATKKFAGNVSYSDHFTVLDHNDDFIILGGRNTMYNLSMHDFTENKQWRIFWLSMDAHSQLCLLKGKSDDDCQNYIRVFVPKEEELVLVCGTNSYKPLCRHYSLKNGKYRLEDEMNGAGVCPYDPEHNSTIIYSDDQVYSATVTDFSGTDPLIYRSPQRTERFDLKQLNAPNFVSSLAYGNYIFFFYRETAVEYINCGKRIYSRVARVCKNDKGGPHQFSDKWTSFLKARLNCSVPGEYPFYFDEIQSTTDIVEGKYGSDAMESIVYGVLTTPTNAIGGSAICAYRMKDIVKAFEGSFKQQESINSNWLPVPKEKIPEPRPGACVHDSRVLQENSVNFVRTHSLMEEAVPALFNQPILLRVSLHYRFTAIAVEPQVATIDDEKFDILYVGTTDGRVAKIVNIPCNDTAMGVLISDNKILPGKTPIKELKMAPGFGKVIIVSRDDVRLSDFNNCNVATTCRECVQLQDPHCAWDVKDAACVSLEAVSTVRRSLIQDVARGDGTKCWAPPTDNKKIQINILETNPTLESDANSRDKKENVGVVTADIVDCENLSRNEILECASRQKIATYSSGTFHLVTVISSIVALFCGFFVGYYVSRKKHSQPAYPASPIVEQHNHLERLSANMNGSFLTPRPNKLVNVPPRTPKSKKENIDTSKDLNIVHDGTLQKIKKTYI